MSLDRRYDLDWLRVLSVLLVVVFHTMMIFVLEPWAVVYIKDTEYIHCFKIISNFIHVFNMPLLFVIAGMSAKFSLKSRKPKQYIKERFSKLLIPALFGCIILNPIMTYIYLISLHGKVSFVEHFSGFFTKNPGDLSGIEGGFTPAHLWFIIFLFVFSLISLPIFLKFSKTENSNGKTQLNKFLTKPFMLIVMALPITLAASTNILEDKNPILYFVMFLLGYLLISDDAYRVALNRDKWGYLIIGCLFSCVGIAFINLFDQWSLGWIAALFATQIASISMVFALLGIGNCYFNKNSKFLQYFSRASFPIYMIHLLINTALGYVVVQLSISALAKFILILIFTLLLSFICYETIKRVPILNSIFGIKQNRNVK